MTTDRAPLLLAVLVGCQVRGATPTESFDPPHLVGSTVPVVTSPTGPDLPSSLTLTVDPLVAGASTPVTVVGAAPDASITLWKGEYGGSSCPPELGGSCLPLGGAVSVGSGLADSVGSWTGVWDVPATEPIGAYPTLIATDGSSRSLVVVRRVWGAPPDYAIDDGVDLFDDDADFSYDEPDLLLPGDYLDLELDGWDGYELFARGNEVVTCDATFRTIRPFVDWYSWLTPPPASASAEGTATETVDGYTSHFEGSSLASGTWTLILSDEYAPWGHRGFYDLTVRTTAPAEPRTWYADADGDGFGDEAEPIDATVAPDGTAWRALDCDDADGLVHPEAWDVCEDGLDTDCSGSDKECHGLPVDGRPVEEAAGLQAWIGTAPYDLAALGDVDGDGVAEVWARDGAALWLIPASAGPSAVIARQAVDGDWGQTAVGDLDHDGTADVAYGIGENGGPGSVVITATPTTPSSVVGAAWATLVGPTATADAGRGLVLGGDVDGDGWGDLVVAGEGSAWLVTSASPGTTPLDLAATATFTGVSGGDLVAPRDLDGDGLADLVVVDESARVFHGPVAGAVGLGSADATVSLDFSLANHTHDVGDTDGDGAVELLLLGGGTAATFEEPLGILGQAAATTATTGSNGLWTATLVDLDRDGFDDLVLGGPTTGWAGAVEVVFGPLPAALSLPGDADLELPAIEGRATGQELRSADYDGDGAEDLAVRVQGGDEVAGAYGIDPSYGFAFVFTAP